MSIEEKYKSIIDEYGFTEIGRQASEIRLVGEAIRSFIPSCSKPAIWCYGEHTKMLMADFMGELKAVKHIIDARAEKYRDASGFKVISKEAIAENGIDGAIISSYKFRREIKETLSREFPELKCLDIYDYMESRGACMDREYYALLHPYEKYRKINRLRLRLKEADSGREEAYMRLIECLVDIKDFFLAARFAEELHAMFPNEKYGRLIADLKEIYNLEREMAGHIHGNNVLMLCFDGLRDKDVSESGMSALARLAGQCFRFGNAYSVSTSTYESLVPAYSENADMRTGYYERNSVAEGGCRFINRARGQGRKIRFYTDMDKHIEGDGISRADAYQTATEKIWSFILDAQGEENGLFYVHILYESHYSYPSPYVEAELVASGTNILFDYLRENGGKIRADYGMQHHVMLKYLDDAVVPFLQLLKCRMAIYADHGNIIIGRHERLEDLKPLQLTYHQDLIKIPLIVKSPEMGEGVEKRNVSLMELNEVIVSLLERKRFAGRFGDFVKAQRSAIYNPDFRYLYREYGYERGLLAFEAFIFEDGHKLGIFSDGHAELVEMDSDEPFEDAGLRRKLFMRVKGHITVCSPDAVEA